MTCLRVLYFHTPPEYHHHRLQDFMYASLFLCPGIWQLLTEINVCVLPSSRFESSATLRPPPAALLVPSVFSSNINCPIYCTATLIHNCYSVLPLFCYYHRGFYLVKRNFWSLVINICCSSWVFYLFNIILLNLQSYYKKSILSVWHYSVIGGNLILISSYILFTYSDTLCWGYHRFLKVINSIFLKVLQEKPSMSEKAQILW